MELPPLNTLTRKQLRDVIRVLVHNYVIPRAINDLDLFLGYQTVVWSLAGRPQSSSEDRQLYVNTALEAVQSMAASHPSTELVQAVEVCFALLSRTSREAESEQLLAGHVDDFAEWSKSLPSASEVIQGGTSEDE